MDSAALPRLAEEGWKRWTTTERPGAGTRCCKGGSHGVERMVERAHSLWAAVFAIHSQGNSTNNATDGTRKTEIN